MKRAKPDGKLLLRLIEPARQRKEPFVGVVLLTLLAFWRFIFVSETRRRHLARQNPTQPHRVTFSRRGVWEAGTYFPLNEDIEGIYLEEVEMTSEPPVLRFRLTKTFSEYSDDNRPWTERLHVLVPRGHEDEAAQLMQRFRTEVIEARKQAQQQARQERNPPEPY